MIVGLMQKLILMLPLICGIFGISDVVVVNYLFGSVVNSLPYPPNDKPIGGSFLPVLAFNGIAILVVIGLSLYSLGIWNVDWTNRKTRTEFVAVGVLFGSLMALFYFQIFLFFSVGSLVYLLVVLLYYLIPRFKMHSVLSLNDVRVSTRRYQPFF